MSCRTFNWPATLPSAGSLALTCGWPKRHMVQDAVRDTYDDDDDDKDDTYDDDDKSSSDEDDDVNTA